MPVCSRSRSATVTRNRVLFQWAFGFTSPSNHFSRKDRAVVHTRLYERNPGSSFVLTATTQPRTPETAANRRFERNKTRHFKLRGYLRDLPHHHPRPAGIDHQPLWVRLLSRRSSGPVTRPGSPNCHSSVVTVIGSPRARKSSSPHPPPYVRFCAEQQLRVARERVIFAHHENGGRAIPPATTITLIISDCHLAAVPERQKYLNRTPGFYSCQRLGPRPRT